MSVISIKQLLEAGVHFGHHTRRWNPKMQEYIFTERNGIYIIDLQKTVKKFDEAHAFVRELSENNGTLLFVGTKKQAQETIMEDAQRCGEFYVTQRWLGGMLTNWKTIQTRIQRLKSLEEMKENGTYDRLIPADSHLLARQEVRNIRGDCDIVNRAFAGEADLRERSHCIRSCGNV